MTVRILFSASRAIGARLIQWTTFSQWSHVELVDGITLLGANWPHGVGRTDMAARIGQARRWALAEVLADEGEVLAFARAQLHRPYDLRGALGIAIRRDWQDDGAWFCSELVAASLDAAGVSVARVDQWRVTPQDLWQSPLLEITDQS